MTKTDPITVATTAATIATQAVNISYIQRDIAEIKLSIKELSRSYASKEELSVVAKQTENRLAKLESSTNLWKWLSPTLSAILSAGVTFLVIQYLIHK